MLHTSHLESSTEWNNETLAALQSILSGELLRPETPAYEEARLAWNRAVEHYPLLIVVAKTAQDIAAAVSYACQNQLGVAVQATGHGNVRPANDCLLILTKEMTGVEIDPAAQTARIEAGVQWGKVLAAAQEYGLAPLLGSSPTVGAVGYTLGGGLGWLARKYGLSADHVLQFEVVTADGQLRTVSPNEHNELFWGLRGGGGSLGVITSMMIRLFPVSQVYAGNLFYPASMAKDVFRHYRAWIANAPDELTSSVLIMNFPPIPQLPEFLRGQSFVLVRGCYCGSLVEGETMLRHWREWRTPVIDDFKTISFGQAATISNDPVNPMPSFSTGAWLRELSDPTIDALVDYAIGRDTPSPLAFAEVRHAGGAIRRVTSDASVYGNRDAEFILCLVGVAPSAADHHRIVTYTDEMKEAIRSDLTGGVYMNFIAGTESQQRIKDGLAPGGYEHLAQLKARVDPKNLFCYSFNVSPK
jgi:FAD/FMN-containing dehydrogenase